MDIEEEVKQLRAYKAYHEGKAVNRAFHRLEQLMDAVNYDPMISVRAFRIIADCLIALKEEMKL
jgi:hypothetical protein